MSLQDLEVRAGACYGQVLPVHQAQSSTMSNHVCMHSAQGSTDVRFTELPMPNTLPTRGVLGECSEHRARNTIGNSAAIDSSEGPSEEIAAMCDRSRVHPQRKSGARTDESLLVRLGCCPD
jgi:hypothetical protein